MSANSCPSVAAPRLKEAIAALVAAAPPTATVTVEWLASLLATDNDSGEAHSGSAVDSAVDLTVEQVARQFGKGASTIRTWLDRGELPGAYKLHGREWRIPFSAIEQLQRSEAKRHRKPAARTAGRVTNIGDWRKHVAVGTSK